MCTLTLFLPATMTYQRCPLRRLRKVGWIFTQSVAERDWIMDSEEIQQMAAVQVPDAKTVCGCSASPFDCEASQQARPAVVNVVHRAAVTR